MPGGELYYEAGGAGVAVVLVHGLALDARMWDDQVPALEDIARVVRYDLRGFGRSIRDAETSDSHADDLWRLVDHLEIDEAVLVGLSMGGRVVVGATLAAPKRVQALVLLDAVLDGVPWDPDSERGMQAIGEGTTLWRCRTRPEKSVASPTASSSPPSASRTSRAGSPRWSAITPA